MGCFYETGCRPTHCIQYRSIVVARYLVDSLQCKGNCSITSNNMKLVHWPLMGGLLHLVQPLPSLTSTWPHLRCDVGLKEGEYQ